ncbi:unnamed protein product [Calypogeia fissa]
MCTAVDRACEKFSVASIVGELGKSGNGAPPGLVGSDAISGHADQRKNDGAAVKMSASPFVPSQMHDDKICSMLIVDGWEPLLDGFMREPGVKLRPSLVVKVVERQSDVNLALRFFKWARNQTGYKHNANCI